MKKLILISAILSLFLIGCSKDDDGGSFAYDKELLYGTWKITQAEGLPWLMKTTTATFYSDGKYSGRGYFGNGSGTYKLSGKRITCYVDGEKFMWYDVTSIDGTTCKMIASDSSGSISITCKKQ